MREARNQRTIRVCTWNIGGGRVRSGPNVFEHENLSYFEEALQSIDADVVCLQEAHSGTRAEEDQVAALSAAIGLPHSVRYLLSESHLKKRAWANIGVLSRWEILSSEFMPLPNPRLTAIRPDGSEWETFEKGYFKLILHRWNRRIGLISGHSLPFHVFGRSAAEPAFASIHQLLDRVVVSTIREMPTILAADLNFEAPEKLLRDSWRAGLRRALPKGPTTQPGMLQFDHIMCGPGFRLRNAAVIAGEADHFLCWSDLELEE